MSRPKPNVVIVRTMETFLAPCSPPVGIQVLNPDKRLIPCVCKKEEKSIFRGNDSIREFHRKIKLDDST